MHPSPYLDCSADLPMTQDEKQFFKAVGARIAELRQMVDTVLGQQDR